MRSGSGRTVAGLHADRASLSDQDAIRSGGKFRAPAAAMDHSVAMMRNPGQLQELPDVTALLSEAASHGEQPAAADRTLAALNAPPVAWQSSDLALNHRLAQRHLGCPGTSTRPRCVAAATGLLLTAGVFSLK